MFCAVILTALPVEYLAIRQHLTDIKEEVHKGTVYERGSFGQWSVGVAEIGAGNAGAATQAERAIDYFQPDVILFVGVAGGIKDKGVNLGDVVASTKIYGYESGKETELGFQPRPAVVLPAFDLEQRARAESRKDDWLNRLIVRDPKPKVFVAPIAAGEKVIASTKSVLYQFLRAHYGDAVAVEMEGFGFLNATRANHQVLAMVVRGISDLIDGKANADATGSQDRAANHASAFAFQLLEKFQPEKQQKEQTISQPLQESGVTSDSRRQFYKNQLAEKQKDLGAVEQELKITPNPSVSARRLTTQAEQLLAEIERLEQLISSAY
jgi:nucleoside phosphorylase